MDLLSTKKDGGAEEEHEPSVIPKHPHDQTQYNTISGEQSTLTHTREGNKKKSKWDIKARHLGDELVSPKIKKK